MSAAVSRLPLDVRLRSQHVDFLHRLSKQTEEPLEPAPYTVIDGEVSESFVISKILEHAKSEIGEAEAPTPRKLRKHFSVDAAHIEFVDGLSRQWGITRSQVVQRLIERAAASNFRIETFEATAALGFGG